MISLTEPTAFTEVFFSFPAKPEKRPLSFSAATARSVRDLKMIGYWTKRTDMDGHWVEALPTTSPQIPSLTFSAYPNKGNVL